MENSVVSTRTKLSIVGTAGLAFCGVLVETSMNVTFPTLSRQFGTTINAVQWVTTAYLLAVACTMVIAADLQRRFKWQRLTTLGGILFIVGDVLCATAPALWPLLGGRLIQGVATGLVMPLVFTIIMRQVPHGIQGRYVGTAGMVVALAPSLGPTYGGWATQQFGWPIIFWLVLPIGIVMWLIALKTIQQPKATPQNLFPLRQLIMIMFTFVGLTLGLNNAGTDGLLSVAALVPLVIAIVAVFIFIRLSLHQPTALINLKIFTNRNFVLLLGIYFLIQFVQIGLTFILPTYAQLVTHQSVMASGMMLLVGSLASAILQPFTGRLLDMGAKRKPFLVGSLILVLALLSLTLLTSRLSVAWMLSLYLLYMIGFSLIFNNALTLALQQLQPNHIGDGNATFNTLQQYAGSLGTAISSAILAAFSHGGTVMTQTINGTRAIFIMMLVFTVLIGLFSWQLRTDN